VRELHNQIAINQFKSGVSASDCRKRLVRDAGFSYDQSKRIVKKALDGAGCSNPAVVRELHKQIAIDQFKSGVSASDCRKRLVREASRRTCSFGFRALGPCGVLQDWGAWG